MNYKDDIFEKIGDLLLEAIDKRFHTINELDFNIEFGDSFNELLDKFVVLHIRTWKLEDLASQEKDMKKLGELKKKIDFCFKVKRPKLIKALNSFLDNHISKQGYKPLSEENIKIYG